MQILQRRMQAVHVTMPPNAAASPIILALLLWVPPAGSAKTQQNGYNYSPNNSFSKFHFCQQPLAQKVQMILPSFANPACEGLVTSYMLFCLFRFIRKNFSSHLIITGANRQKNICEESCPPP